MWVQATEFLEYGGVLGIHDASGGEEAARLADRALCDQAFDPVQEGFAL